MKASAMLLKILNSCNWEKVNTRNKKKNWPHVATLVCAYTVKTNVIIFTQSVEILSECKINQKGDYIVETILYFSLLIKTRFLHI